MRLDFDAPQTLNAGMHYSDQLEAGDRAWNDALAQAKRSVTPGDILNELMVEREADLAKASTAESIGRIYLDARDALINRLALREVTL